MFTQCPSCNTLFKAHAQNLGAAMGMVRCTKCANVFNALAAQKEATDAEQAQAVDLRSQLSVRQFGDVQLIDPSFLASQEWFKDSLEATRPQLPPKEQTAP